MDQFHVRAATAADANGIAVVHVDSWRETYPGIVPQSFLDALSYEKRTKAWLEGFAEHRPSEKVLVVENQNKNITGFAVAGKSREPSFVHEGELHAIYLLRNLQGRGLGRMLFEKCVDALHGFGFQSMFVWVLRENPALNFYLRMGAKEFSAKPIEIGGQQLEEVALGWERI